MLRLRTDLIRRLLRDLGGVEAVLRRWPGEPVPNRSTFSRWLGGTTVPQSAHQLLSLAAALDVDPFALWSAGEGDVARIVSRIQLAMRRGQWGNLYPALAFIEYFNGPTPEWPPTTVSTPYYRRLWTTYDFQHRLASITDSHYATVILRTDMRRPFHEPQVFHFAWRDASGPISDWRPYGLVEARPVEGSVRLLHFNGLSDAAPMTVATHEITVETFFGPRAADFRVASLHPFHLHVLGAPRLRPTAPTVRFP